LGRCPVASGAKASDSQGQATAGKIAGHQTYKIRRQQRTHDEGRNPARPRGGTGATMIEIRLVLSRSSDAMSVASIRRRPRDDVSGLPARAWRRFGRSRDKAICFAPEYNALRGLNCTPEDMRPAVETYLRHVETYLRHKVIRDWPDWEIILAERPGRRLPCPAQWRNRRLSGKSRIEGCAKSTTLRCRFVRSCGPPCFRRA